MSDTEFNALFPRDQLLQTFAELGSWTRVSDLLKAGRILEDRLLGDEAPTGHLILTFPDDDVIEFVLIRMLDLLFHSYRCPHTKVLLAAREDPMILASTCQTIENSVLNVTVKVGKPESLHHYHPSAPEHPRLRFFHIEDQPHMLELASAPMRVLRLMTVGYMENALRLAKLKREAKEKTGGAPIIFHRHNADSRLPAVLDAIAFYVCAHDIGYTRTVAGVDIDAGYRHVALVGVPPFDERAITSAKECQAIQFNTIRS